MANALSPYSPPPRTACGVGATRPHAPRGPGDRGMTALTFSVPGLPPSVNSAYQHTAGGGKRRKADVIAWQTRVGQVVSNAAIWAEWALPPQTPFTLTVQLTAP